MCEVDTTGGIEEEIKLPPQFNEQEAHKNRVRWKNEIKKSYDQSFKEIARKYEEVQHNLLDVVFKPKRSINKFSELHKGMYKAYQLVNKKKIERLLE